MKTKFLTQMHNVNPPMVSVNAHMSAVSCGGQVASKFTVLLFQGAKALHAGLAAAILLFSADHALADNPLAPCLGFNAFISGNFTQGTSDVQGPVACGGNFSVTSSALVAGSYNTCQGYANGPYYPPGSSDSFPTVLVVGGQLNLSSSCSVGNSTYIKLANTNGFYFHLRNGSETVINYDPNSSDTSPQFDVFEPQTSASIAAASGINFTTSFTSLENYATQIAALSSSATVAVWTGAQLGLNSGGANLGFSSGQNITSGKINVYNVTVAQLANIQNLNWNGYPTASTPVIFNVSDKGSITLPNFNLSDTQAPYLLWNFYQNAGTITIPQSEYAGGFLAPQATVQGSGSDFAGQMVAATYLSGQGELHAYAYLVNLPIGTPSPTASLAGSVWLDVNGNGQVDAADTNGISPVTISLYNGSTLVGTTTTAANGSYSFSNLSAGTYKVVQTVPTGYTNTTTTNLTVTLASSQASTGNNYLDTQPAAIGDFVWVDSNGNGLQDSGEPGLSGVTVTLYQTNSGSGNLTTLATTTSSSAGAYSFTGLLPNTNYLVGFSLPAGYTRTTPNVGSNTNLDSNANVTSGLTTVFALSSGQVNNSIDAGYVPLGSLAGSVWLDVNGNGQVDAADTNGISPVTISLYNGSTLVGTTTTAANGSYSFSNLSAGTYKVVQTVPTGYTNTTTTNLTVTLAIGQASMGNNYLDTQPAAIGDFVWVDSNGNGLQDSGEPGLSGVTVTLYQTNSGSGNLTTLATTTSSSAGAYSFTGLLPNTNYLVGFSLPAGYTRTTPNVGSNTNLDSNANVTSGLTTVFALSSGQVNNSIDAGYMPVISLSGTVFDDANGLTDGVVNGIGTNVLGTLHVNLLNASSNVLATTAVTANGTYAFPNVLSGNDLVELSTTAGTVGSAAPAALLPANWVHTGGSTNGVIAGNTNGLLPATVLTANVINENFGIDQLPVAYPTNASYALAAPVFVPALTGSDPEQGPLGGTTNTVVITTVPNNGTLLYNGSPVWPGEVIANYTPSILIFNPSFQGAGVATFTFQIADAAGEVSPLPALVTLTFTGLNLSGTVFNDTNGLTDGVVNGTVTNLNGALYVNLVNAAGNVLTNVAVSANGTYVFTNVLSGSYTVQLTTNAGTIGSPMPVTGLPAGWGNAGGSVAGVIAGNTNGLIPVSVISANVTAVNFGIWQLGTIGDYTWLDVNGNGLQDPGEPSLAGVTEILYQSNAVTTAYSAVATNVSSASGFYEFTNVPPGVYLVSFSLPVGSFTRSPQLAGSNTNINSAASATTGLTHFYTLAPGQTNLSLDAGYVPASTPVDVVSLTAVATADGVLVTWRTYDELDLLAFDVARSTAGGPAQDVTPDYVMAVGQDVGATYQVTDAGATASGVYTYTLYAIDDNLTVEDKGTVTVRVAASVAPGTAPVITSLTISGGTAVLSWSGGQPPYVVEQATALGANADWQPVGAAQTGTQMAVPLTNQAGFFRVGGSGN